MAKSLSIRFCLLGALLASAVVLLGAGTAAAKEPAGALQGGKHTKVSKARALGGSNRCLTRRSKRANTTRIRRRCKPPVAGAPAQPLYWGATIGDHLTGDQAPWDMNAVAKFEEETRKPVSLIQFYQPFANCSSSPCTFYDFPKGPMELIRGHGAIPVLSWASQSTPSTCSKPKPEPP